MDARVKSLFENAANEVKLDISKEKELVEYDTSIKKHERISDLNEMLDAISKSVAYVDTIKLDNHTDRRDGLRTLITALESDWHFNMRGRGLNYINAANRLVKALYKKYEEINTRPGLKLQKIELR